MTLTDLQVISPLIVAILTAIAIMVVDLIRPGSTMLAAATAFIGLALTAVTTLVCTPRSRPARAAASPRSAAPTRSTR